MEKSNEVEREREPQRLLQIEAMREQVSKCATAKERGNNAGLMRVKQALPALLSKYLKDLEMDEKDGLSSDVVETWKQAALDFTGDVLKGKGRSSEGAPKGGGESSSRAGKEGPGMRSGEESKEWRPSSRGQEVPPDPPGDPGPRNKVMQARAQPEAHEHECRRRRHREGSVPDHEKPGSRCRLSKAHNLPEVLGIWNGEGMGRGRSVHE